jgi:hypothetical protein
MTELLYDTIGTDTLATDSVSSTETPPAFYENMGFFQGDSLLHPEVKVGQSGFCGIPRAYQLWRDEWVVLFVLVCFMLLAIIQKRIRKQLSSEAKEFFFPSKSITRKEKREKSFEQLIPIILAFILSIMGGLGVFMYTQKQLHLFLGQTSPYALIGVYIGIWMLYFILKNLMYAFVNWIFFDKDKRELWRKSYFFLFSAESILFFALIISTIFLNLSPAIPLWIIVILGLLIKLLHLYKVFQIFFPKIYGTLHLIVYFCTLEIMPLMAVFKVLIRVTDELIVKF